MNVTDGKILPAGMPIPDNHLRSASLEQPIHGGVDFSSQEFARFLKPWTLVRHALQFGIEDATHTFHVRYNEHLFSLTLPLHASSEDHHEKQGRQQAGQA